MSEKASLGSRIFWQNCTPLSAHHNYIFLGKSNEQGGRTALNLVHAFAVALKHHLRFEPDVAYKDLVGLVGHLDTFAKDAHDPDVLKPRRKSPWKAAGEYLGVSFAESNPRKLIKRAKKPLGHLPIEILSHLSAYIDHCVKQGILPSALHQGQISKKLDLEQRLFLQLTGYS
jgi:hypothetical protein